MLSAVKLLKSVSMSGTFGDREAHIGEDLGDLVHHLADRMDAALGQRALAHRQRDVGAFLRQLLSRRRLRQLPPPRFERLADAKSSGC